MQKIIPVIVLLGVFIISTNYAFSQEPSLATFQETAQVLIDQSKTQNVTASIILQTTSIQEMKIPAELENKIRDHERINSVVITNQKNCILGVTDESCILINVQRDPSDKGIIEIQDSTRAVGELFIDEINQTFDTKAKFHSTFVHSDDEYNRILETSGVVSGRGTVSAVYTMPMEDSGSMYEKISAILIPKEIRDSGGFYEIAKNLSSKDNAKVTFSIIPLDNNSLFQLKLSLESSVNEFELTPINPLGYFGINELKRSDYFYPGFYPLNSIFQIVLLAAEPTKVSNVQGKIIPTQIIDGEKIPMEITKDGWVFDPEEGSRIQGKYIFGQKNSLLENDLIFSIGDETTPPQASNDESIIVLAIIIVGGIGAAIFFLKGYKK